MTVNNMSRGTFRELRADCKKPFPSRKEKGPVFAKQVKKGSGFGVITHSFETGLPIVNSGKCYPG